MMRSLRALVAITALVAILAAPFRGTAEAQSFGLSPTGPGAPQSGSRTFTSCVVGTTSTQCLAALAGRRALIVENHSGESGAPTAVATGVTCTEGSAASQFVGWLILGKGGSLDLELPNVIPSGALNCISNGTASVTITVGQL